MRSRWYFEDKERQEKFKEVLFSWLGTPYKHMGRCKGRAADCSLFLAEIGLEVGIYEKLEYDYYPRDWHLHVKEEYLLEGIRRNEKNLREGLFWKEIDFEKEELKFGDWLLFSTTPMGVTNHSGVYIGNGEFIHAAEDKGVSIKKLTPAWKKRLTHVLRLYERTRDREKGFAAIVPLALGTAAALGVHFAFGVALTSFWAGLAFMAGDTLGLWLFRPGMTAPNIKMKPASLSDFSMTQSNEGHPIPLVYGTAKIPGNIIWYGNLKVEEVRQKVKGGKGHSKSKSQTVGYKYYLDVWYAICLGKVEIVKTYVNEKEKSPSYRYSIFNDGTGDAYPSELGLEYATRLKGVAHIFYKKLYTGAVNNTFLPQINFVVRRWLDSPVHYANMYNIGGKDYGNNPAAIIYDLLVNHCDVPPAEIDINSFNTCAEYFYNNKLGLNFAFTSQREAKELINYVLSFVDAVLTIDPETGKIGLKIIEDSGTPVDTIKTEDLIDFQLTKPFWAEKPNDFRGAIIDPNKDFSLRVTLAARNTANIYQTQEVKERTVDLTPFQDTQIGFSRIYKIMKRESYPHTFLTIKTTRKFSMLQPGDIVRVINDDYNLDGQFRIIRKVDEEITKNELTFDLVQLKGFDSVFAEPTLPSLPPEQKLKPLSKTRVFELPYFWNMDYRVPSYLLLASKEIGIETMFIVLISTNGTDYDILGQVTSYSLVGTLVEDYPSDTNEIDDDRGILFEPYFDFMQFDNVSRADMFLGDRAALIGNELVLFQNYEPEGDRYYRLKGVVRGVGYTDIENHSAGDEIWIFHPGSVTLPINRSSTFYLKFVPVTIDEEGDMSEATAIRVTPQFKAMKPLAPARVVATRNGDQVQVQVYPRLKEHLGAGFQSADSYTDEYPIQFEGSILYKINNGDWVDNGNSAHFTITNASSFTLYVKHHFLSYDSPVVSLSVGSADGDYIANSY